MHVRNSHFATAETSLFLNRGDRLIPGLLHARQCHIRDVLQH
jgi:hypothetical protein